MPVTAKKNKSIEELISQNPRLVLYLILILFGLVSGYQFEAEGKIDSPLVLIPMVFVFPASIGVFIEIYKRIKKG